MEDMAKYLPEADREKLKTLFRIKEQYKAGRLSLEAARAELKREVGTLRPYEIALAEQQLKEVEEDECRKEDIQQMLALFDGLLDTSRPSLPPEHPIMCYYRENDALRKLLLEIEDLVQYPVIKNQWLALYDRLRAYRLHLARKQNQLYSVLEKKGFDRPTTTMWLLDDYIRDEIREARTLLDEDKEEAFIALQQTLVDDIRDLIQKEETVLYPTALAMITPAEFEEMKAGDREIGFAWIDTPRAETGKTEETPPETRGFADELAALLAKYGYGTSKETELEMNTGKLTLEQVNLLLKHLPMDISFVDEQELVKFYSDTDHRIFPRSKNVIGRNVKNCHPRTSVHVVEEIIRKFRTGEQDHAEFWINKPGAFIYIYYAAIRDARGRFRGILEVMQDCTHIRSLQGSRTLLTWDGEAEAPATLPSEEMPAEHPAPAEGVTIDAASGETLLKDLFATYPGLKEKLVQSDPRFKLLNTPLAKVLFAKATLSKVSARSGMPLDRLIETLKRLIEAQ